MEKMEELMEEKKDPVTTTTGVSRPQEEIYITRSCSPPSTSITLASWKGTYWTRCYFVLRVLASEILADFQKDVNASARRHRTGR